MKPVKYLMLSLLGMSLHVSAQTVVDDAWVRATVPGQPSSGAFMHITAATDSKLVEVKSPVAKTVQIHESKMENDVMSMQAVPSIALPAGKTVNIEPEGYHVMLIDLVGQIKEGDNVPLTLIVEDSKGIKESIEVQAQARALNTMPMHDHQHMH
ncbi:copper chaperone PCu(A)C [Pseudomonas helleri]|uniref:Copper chaperone PCu(A)C n=1 Tax=Pseudomonas helleri TaxID=1608996 RepID=A0A6A7YZD2_9PSED|nr:copper chaperone PCu(A)C [Pseudomonas helleri]MQT25688.1 copper chaperone PCu(A)C [Pseudomonas helleri]MQT80776.1 copper chaperone PCu(A)C [Pseudomonas helleri]MQU16938.1 copper chaperone PCu(A)C [Pseudomonas helleri]MQU26873.1 copper chaperone PCu(A)C [Pseudomonas helleri]